MWRRLFGGGNSPASRPAQQRAPDAESAAARARESTTGDEDEELDEIPFDADELPEMEAGPEAAHADASETGEWPDGETAPSHAEAQAAMPAVRILPAGPRVAHEEDVSPYEDRPEMAREEYEMLVSNLPMPHKKQMRAFAEYVAGAKNWHQELPLLPAGAVFYFYLDPFAGMDRILLAGEHAAFVPRTADAEDFQGEGLPTEEYRERFGFLAFACAAASRFVQPVQLEVDGKALQGTLDNNANYPVLWVPRKPFRVPEAILKSGACTVTGVVHPDAACPAAWQSTLAAVTTNHSWPAETGGAATLARIRARVAATGPADEVDADLQAAIEPERRRILDEMVAAMARMVSQLHGSL